MRAISLRQPWAGLIASGASPVYSTMVYDTSLNAPLAIVSPSALPYEEHLNQARAGATSRAW